MEETVWPTKKRLKELRDQGLFPYSVFAVRAAAAAALVTSLFLMRGKFGELTVLLRKILAEPTSNLAAVKLRIPQLVEQLQILILVPSVIVIIFSLLLVLMQSKFFFSFINLSFDLSQVVPFRKGTIKSLFIALIVSVVGLFTALGFGALSAWWGIRDVWKIALVEPPISENNLFIKTLGSQLGALIAIWCFFLLVASIIFYVAARISFLSKNKMNKMEADWD